MIRFALILAAVGVSGLYGCSACCGPYDFDYPVVGGMHQRANPAYGRVGSRFSDPFFASGPSSDSNLEAPPQPRVRDAEREDSDDRDDLDDLDELDRKLDEAEEDLDLDMIDDDELEPIEPMRDSDLDEELENLDRDDSESTAFNRWRARPLRQR